MAASECCPTAAATLSTVEDFEQCANDMENFQDFLQAQCNSLLISVRSESEGLDVTASDSALGINDDFVQYGTINMLVGFETIRTAAMSEEGCSVTATTPLTYDYCPGMVGSSLNSLATTIATSTTRITENNKLMECLMGYADAYCADEVSDYISNVVVPEEAAQSGYSMDLDSVLSSWVALAGGDAVSLEA